MDERFERWSGKMRVHIIYFPFFAKKKGTFSRFTVDAPRIKQKIVCATNLKLQ